MSTGLAATRADLLALTPDSLAALTNRGLVKRATKEIDQAGPAITVDGDGTVGGEFPDGAHSRLPAGGLDAGTCSCGATGVCRHLVGLVLAYQRWHGTDPAAAAAQIQPSTMDPPPSTMDPSPAAGLALPVAEPAPPVVTWSPGEFTDEQLAAHLGARAVAAAQRALRAGYSARVRRPSAADPVATVELGTATVRFLVPHGLGFVHTDAARGARSDIVALAVWAFRVADERAPGVPDVQVDVGGTAAGGGPGLDATLLLAEAVLRDGAVHAGAGIAAALATEENRLDAAGLRWPLLALGELADQLAAYQERSARYQPGTLARLVLELYARDRAAAHAGGSRRARVLGTDEAAETPLRRVRLDALGCRVRADGERCVAELFFAHADTATVLVLRRGWDGVAGGTALARRRIAGSTVGALAAGDLVTESVVRTASRTIRAATSRVAQATVSPSQGRWDELPAALVVRDIAALDAELAALPPRLVRARVEAELVRVVQIAGVLAVGYSPGQQRLDAVIVDWYGTRATITATHSAAAPGRLDAIAAALDGQPGKIRFVSGAVHRSAGGVVIDPLAFAADNSLVVPDLAAATASRLAPDSGAAPGPLAAALAASETLLTEVAHRGLLHLPASYPQRLRDAARTLATVGLHRVAAGMERFAAALGPDPGEAAVQAWVEAYLRVDLALDLC